MDNETFFYIVGPLLAVSAVVVAFIGLRFEKFPGRFGPLVALWFIVLVGTATSFAVLHSKDEEVKKEQERGLPEATQESESAEQQ
ncbi:MAG TPA: hypothetical protein VJ989_04960 [Solirubrobacterales bacterium]|nr:hypothetical protein [Solirubrobacterales bacterium]